jgi:hypothetical protein
MKKIVFSILFIIIFITNTYGQFGIRAGVNMANEIRSFNSIQNNFKSENLTAFHIGLVWQVPFGHTGFGTEIGALYSQKGSFFGYADNNSQNLDSYDELNYIEVPLNVRFKLSAGGFGIYGTVGAYAAYLLMGQTINEATYEVKNISFMRSNDHLDYGISAGIGVEVFRKIQLGATWSFGLKGNKINTLDELKMSKNKVFSVNLTYLF